MTALSRLVHTVRWLRPGQIAAQVAHRARRFAESPAAWARRPVPPDPGTRWDPLRPFLPPGAQRNRAEDLAEGRFTFLNRTEKLGWPPRWEGLGVPRLWEYNLHYFEYLWSLPYGEGRALCLDWIERHRIDRGRTGWEPYPVSLRLMNWCAYFFGRHRERSEHDAPLRSALWPSIHLQAEWLAAHLEFHLLGNHLLENAAALAVCGSCFAGDASDAWLRRGLDLLAAELPEQVLPDGGHFERSPMYQARIVYVLDLLANSGSEALRRAVEDPRARAQAALARLCHPDGEIALLNDSAFGIANAPVDLVGPVHPVGNFALPDTGYYGARSGQGHYVVCDAAPIGPDYLPGHAHGDILSFELSLAGQRVVVDAGVHGYEADAMRRYCRSTRAHNTVEIDGEDQCEFWAAFRVARRGRPRDVAWREEGEGFSLEAWHDGYERLPGRPRHRRRFRWHSQGALLVRDRVEASRPVRSCSRLHLHPACEVRELTAAGALVVHPAGTFRVAFAGPGALSVDTSPRCSEFGREVEGRDLVYTSRGAQLDSGFALVHGSADLRYELAHGAVVGGARLPL